VPTCTGGICPPLNGPVEAQINSGSAQITGPTPTASVCQLFFGYNNANESGALSVNNGTLNMCNEIFVGYNGKGLLNITNGGVVNTSPVGASIASHTGSNGTVTVSGANSRWAIIGALYLGGTINGTGGTGLLSVTNSAVVTAYNVQVYPSGTITGNGTLTTSTASGTIVDGTLKPSGQLTIGGSGGLTLHGSATTLSNVVPTGADNVNVATAAMLGGRLSVTMTGTFTPGTTYTLLHCGGTRNGMFGSQSITYPTGQCFTPVVTYDANNV
jgi:T5SS/PEP-CTERM-associated repeat protein